MLYLAVCSSRFRGGIQKYKMAVIGIISAVAEEHHNNEIDTMENRRNMWA